MIGSRLGAYEITAKLGEGGMGEVYRATDSRLRREVAIKVLPAAFTEDKERLARFEREAQLLAQLHHPNIASIFGLEQTDGVRALVMELVEGPTLAERLVRRDLSLEESLLVARQIAEALEAAHEKGIVHRDLKPQNIKIAADGTVKVLDFGLAKALDPVASGSAGASPVVMNSPTLTAAGTQIGVILGTAAYMAPEQAKGQPVDKRADIWAFGVVVYEMLTRRPLFAGDSVPETLASVLRSEIDFSALPAETPVEVARVLQRCLERTPKHRLHDIADARIVLEDAAPRHASSISGFAPPRASRSRGAVLVAAGLLAGVALGGLGWRALAPRAGDPSASPVARLSIVAPPGQRLLGADLSPDGTTIALRLRPQGDRQARPRLFLRPLARFDAAPVEESDGVRSFAFSPDSRWLYFVAPVAAQATQARIARMPIGGGSAPVTVRRWEEGWQGWTVLASGDILVSAEGGGKFLRLPGNGADPAPARVFVSDIEGASFNFTDQRLPDGSPLLRVQHYGSRGYQDAVAALDLASGKVRLLVEDAAPGIPLASGQLLFGRGDALLVAPFDAASRTVTDAPRSVLTGLRTIDEGEPYPRFSLAQNGTLLYPPGGRVSDGRRLVVVDARGTVTPWSNDRMPFLVDPAVSANGRLVLTAMEPNGLLYEIWLADLESRNFRRLVSTPGVDNSGPIPSRDGSRVAYRRYARSAGDGVYVRSIDRVDDERRLVEITPTTNYAPLAWSPDGARLLAVRITDGRTDVVALAPDRAPAEAPRPLLATPFDEGDASFAPDGRALAFVSNETGRNEVYVAPLRPDGSVGLSIGVSAGPGVSPRWRPDGRALFFFDGQDHILSVPIATAPRLSAGDPEVLLDLPRLGLTGGFSVLPDGRLVAVARGENEGEISRFDVVLGFTAELARGVTVP